MNCNSFSPSFGWCGGMFKNFLSEYSIFLRWLGKYTTPTQVTIGRGLLIIPAWYLWIIVGSLEAKIWAIVIMVISWIGDHLDGALARATNQVTELGKKLDPLIDKIVFYGSAIVFWDEIWLVSFLPLFLLDLISTFARETVKNTDTGANIYGKYKLTFQVASSIMFALAEVMKLSALLIAANALISIALILALISVSKRTIPTWKNLPNLWQSQTRD